MTTSIRCSPDCPRPYRFCVFCGQGDASWRRPNPRTPELLRDTTLGRSLRLALGRPAGLRLETEPVNKRTERERAERRAATLAELDSIFGGQYGK